MLRSAVVLTFLLAGLCGQAEDLAALLAPICAQHEMPAMGAAVIVDGKLVALGVHGVRKVGDEAAVTKDDQWHLGSCTKAMTATLLAKQVAAGKFQWSTTLAQALPQLAEGMHEQARAITVAQLLQHRAGLPANPARALWRSASLEANGDRELRRRIASALLSVAPEAKLGERFLYSNAGYMVAGAIAERTADASWQDLLRQELFLPLGMQHAGFGPPGQRDRCEQPWGHVTEQGKSKPLFEDNPSALGPAGTVHASLADWAKFVSLHLGIQQAAAEPATQPAAEALLNAAALAALHQPPKGADYACGWVQTTRPWAPGPILTHNGSNTMWFAVCWLAPEVDFAVLVTCNHGDGQKACDAVAAACIRRFRR